MAKYDLFERYNPQTPKSQLASEITSNYAATANYYRQRQKMFQQVLKNQANRTLESFESQINDSISKLWESNTYKILEELYFDKTMTSEQKINQIKTTFDTSPFLNDYIEAIKKSNFYLFRGRMGLIFEEFINEEIFTPYFEACSTFAGRHLNSIVSGAMTSLSSVTKGVKNIRSDILVSLNDVSFDKKDGVLYGKTKQGDLPLELQRTLTINWDDALPSFQNESETEDAAILNKFLGNGDFFGFSAKIYNANDDNKHFSQSSTIQAALNDVFWYPTRYTQKRHSWEIDYSEIYVIWNLSKVLRTIVSPTTIAMLYGDGMMWMSNFFQNKIFYMNISYQTQINKHYAGDGRIFPTINSPSIYTKNFNIGKGLTALNTKIANKTNTFNKKKYKGIELILT